MALPGTSPPPGQRVTAASSAAAPLPVLGRWRSLWSGSACHRITREARHPRCDRISAEFAEPRPSRLRGRFASLGTSAPAEGRQVRGERERNRKPRC
jgi:hypothetical protein